jgi:predicted nucleic acid-binding protein
MKVLIDTNVAIDVLMRREPFFENSQMVLLLSEQKFIEGFVSASSITDIFYIISKELKNKIIARNLLKNFICMVDIAEVDGDTVAEAIDAEWDDFEDSIQYAAGTRIGVDYIVTRNIKDFAAGGIKAVTPEELLDKILTG